MPTPNEQLQANLSRIFTPINEAIDLDFKLSVADRDRREQRAEELRREKRADKKADKDLARQEKRDLLRIAIENGVEIPDGATNNQIVKLIKDRKEAIAKNALKQTKSVYDVDRKRVESRRKELESKREKIINESLAPLQKAQILKGLLTIPEYDNAIRKESRKKVEELMKMDLTRATDNDVDSLVQGIYSDIKSNTNLFWFDKGGEKIADAFNMSYNKKVGEQLMASKNAEYAEWQEQMNELSRESQTIERGRSDALKSVIRDHGPYLSDDTISELTAEAEPLASVAPPIISQNIKETIAKAGSDVPAENVPNPIQPQLDPLMNSGGFLDSVNASLREPDNAGIKTDPSNPFKVVGVQADPEVKIDFENSLANTMLKSGRGIPSQFKAPTPVETTTQMVASRLQERGAEEPYPMTPAVIEAVIKIASAKHGADPALFPQFRKKILAGDKTSIALWNQYVEDAQQLEQGAPAVLP